MATINNLTSLTEGVEKAVAAVGRLKDAVKDLTSNLTAAAQRANRAGGGGGGGGGTGPTAGELAADSSNILKNSLASFSSNGRLTGFATGAAKIALAPIAGAYTAAPDVGPTIDRASGYYQTRIGFGSVTQSGLEKSTVDLLNGGITSQGSDARAALTLRSMYFMPNSATFKQTMSEVGGAAKYLGMSNESAASALGGMQTGQMSANLYQYGINTLDPSNGKARSTADIAKDMYSMMFRNGATQEQVQQSLQYGFAGANLRNMGLSADQQQIFSQAFLDIAGKTGNADLSQIPSAGENPLKGVMAYNTQQAELTNKFESPLISGFETAIASLDAFNKALGFTAQALGRAKGMASGMAGSNIGQGMAVTASMMASGIGDIATATYEAAELLPGAGGGQGFTGVFAGAGSTSYYTAAVGGDGSGGTNAGAGTATVVQPLSSTKISAKYGQKGKHWKWKGYHTGQDYPAPVGTPVKAVKDGTVFNDYPGGDFGINVQIDHGDGYQTLYAHLSRKTVAEGDQVKAGQIIGYVGRTGIKDPKIGSHLHFEVRRGTDNPINPTAYLSGQMGGGTATSATNQGASDLASILGGPGGSGDAALKAMGISSDVAASLTSLMTGMGSGGEALTGMMSQASALTNLAASNMSASTTTSLKSGYTGGASLSKGTKAQRTWARNVLKALKYPTTDENIKALIQWNISRNGGWSVSDGVIALQMPNNKDLLSSLLNGYGAASIVGGSTGAGAAVQGPVAKPFMGPVAPGSANTAAYNGSSSPEVIINVNIAHATEAEAVALAKRVKTLLDNDLKKEATVNI